MMPAMRLTVHEQERLLITVAAGLARERRERGLVLNHPEATAFVLERMVADATARRNGPVVALSLRKDPKAGPVAGWLRHEREHLRSAGRS
jgi:urease gamma subunit